MARTLITGQHRKAVSNSNITALEQSRKGMNGHKRPGRTAKRVRKQRLAERLEKANSAKQLLKAIFEKGKVNGRTQSS